MSKESALANGMLPEIYERYLDDGFTDEEIAEIWQHTLYFRGKMREHIGEERSEHDVTCSTYERTKKKTQTNVENWMGFRK